MNDMVTVLIADDQPDMLFATSRVVKSCGHQVVEASSGAQALDAARRHQPDLILLDVVMPDASGLDICRQIKRDPQLKGIFVVMISGQKTSSLEQAEGLDIGADGYIARPITNQELKARVNAWVRILLAERQRDRLIVKLQAALDKIKQLSGLLPICMYCKKIRDETGYWNQLEAYIHDHSEADFSHSICQECLVERYPDLMDDP